jgi:hypothetical protein
VFDAIGGAGLLQLGRVPLTNGKASVTAALSTETKYTIKANYHDFGEGKLAVTGSHAEVQHEVKFPPVADLLNDEEALHRLVNAGRSNELDDIVKTQGDKMSDQQLENLTKARFGIEVKEFKHKGTDDQGRPTLPLPGSDNLPDKSLQHLYELLTKVPLSHVKDNPSLLEIDRAPDADTSKATGTSSWSPEGKIVLCGQAKTTPGNALGNVKQLPTVDENCQPKDNVAPPYFDFTALHEVGHAVDDKKKFMKGHLGDVAFGGWNQTELTLEKVAEAGAKEFGKDWLDYITDKLSDKNPTPPGPPSGTTAANWKKAQDKVDAWCDGIRVTKNLWNDGTQSTTLAFKDGTLYQESYKDEWHSYKVEARKRGITGYQFRAPGEWFAELYAAFQSGKLKDNHPSMSWLKTL